MFKKNPWIQLGICTWKLWLRDRAAATAWLVTPNIALRGKTPQKALQDGDTKEMAQLMEKRLAANGIE